jgi:hydroxymethylpyrimidine pyrophosphatase-like HAD family hydrolase
MWRVMPDAGSLFNAPAITANGSYLYDFAADRCVGRYPLQARDVLDIVGYARDLCGRVGVRVATEWGFLADADTVNEHLAYDLSRYTTFEARCVPFARWETEGEQFYKVVFRGAWEDLCAIRPAIEEKFGAAYEYNASSETFLEIQTRGVNKATALSRLASLIAAEDGHPVLTVAVGDHENDLAMLRAADVAACPAGALQEVKGASKWQLCDCEDGAIADLIERLEHAGI